jgi:hypothetical protein
LRVSISQADKKIDAQMRDGIPLLLLLHSIVFLQRRDDAIAGQAKDADAVGAHEDVGRHFGLLLQI